MDVDDLAAHRRNTVTLPAKTRAQVHATFVGKLGRVCRQIEQHLLQTVQIAGQSSRDRGVNECAERHLIIMEFKKHLRAANICAPHSNF